VGGRGISVSVAYPGVVHFGIKRCVNRAPVGGDRRRRGREKVSLAGRVNVEAFRTATEGQGVLSRAAGCPLEGDGRRSKR
jgi:hypothetical protein